MPSYHLRCAVLCAVLALTTVPVWGGPAPAEPDRTEPVQPLTAYSLASWVLAANPGLAAVEAAAAAAAYRIGPAGSLDDPSIGYAVAPLTASADRSLNQSLEFSQRIPWPGTLAAREAAARHEATSADRDVDTLRLRVIAQAKSAYAEWRYVGEGLAIHHATQALLEELISTTRTRYAAGRALKQDVLQAEIERAAFDNHLLQLQRQQASVKARINALLNREPDAPLPPAAQIAETAVPPALQSLQTLALRQYPELAALDAQVSAGQSRVILAEKAFYPNFEVGVGYNGFMDETDKRPVFGVSINVPFDRSKRRSELNRAQADTRRAQWSLAERRAELLSELAQAHARVLETQASVQLYEDRLVPLTAAYFDAALNDYRSGSGAFLNVITAEQRKLDTDLSLARARADYVRRLAELERWVGGPINAAQSRLPGEQP